MGVVLALVMVKYGLVALHAEFVEQDADTVYDPTFKPVGQIQFVAGGTFLAVYRLQVRVMEHEMVARIAQPSHDCPVTSRLFCFPV